MSRRARSLATARRASMVVLLGLVTACEGDGPTNPDGRGLPVDLSLTITLQAEQGGGEAAAFDKVTAMHIRIAPEGGAALFEQSAPFDPQAETRVPVSVLIDGETQATLEVTLLRNTDPLFRGTTSLTLVPNDVAVADLTLVPVAAAISVPSSIAPLTSIGETRPLAGDVLFVTGDVAESLHLTWTSLTPGVVAVETVGGASSVVAVAPGQGQLRATFGVFTSTVQVLVDVKAASVDVTPAASTIDVGASVQLSFTARDGLGNPIAGSTATWSSDDETVATVDQTGRVTGHRAGTATISATVEEAVGTASVEVRALPPSVTTSPAQAVGVSSATLRASVNPNLTPTTAWFEWGTDPSLASFTETPHLDVGSGSVAQAVSQAVEGLDPSTTYYFRAVAANDGGTVTGSIASFSTLALVPPDVQALSPATIASTSATLAGTVDPNGAPTTAWFEWGTDPTMGKYATTPVQDMGAGVEPVSIQEFAGGLIPDGRATYYYRVAADNEAPGVARSSVVSFTTAPAAPSDMGGGFDGAPVYLYWTDNSSSETYFQVEWSASASGPWAVTGTSPKDSPYFTESGPFPGDPTYYRVRACNATGCSEPSAPYAVSPGPPSVSGTLWLCYSSGTSSCTYLSGGAKVELIGPVSLSTSSDAYGYYYFSGFPQGSYTIRVSDISCYASFRVHERNVTFGYGGAEVDFYADTVLCGALAPAAPGPSPFDPVIAGLLGLHDQPSPRAEPAPR